MVRLELKTGKTSIIFINDWMALGSWYQGEALVVAGDSEDHQRLLEIYHDG
jgi:hypothetical protein